MLKVEEPIWNRSSLGCHAAPIKNGSSISLISVNASIALSIVGCIDYLAYGAFFTCVVFPFVAEEAKN
jgi:hypothetical protein